jgi:hypothetical protein
MVATRFGSPGNGSARPIWALRNAGSDKGYRGRRRTSETDLHCNGECCCSGS